jgi:hypothetical protein
MADVFGIAQTGEVALSAATARTVLQLVAPANRRVKVLGWGVFFDGVSATAEPVQVRLLRQTTAGTMSALTPAQMRPVAETIQTSAQHSATSEPEAGDVVDCIEVHPQMGYEKLCPMGQEIIVGGGGRIGIECLAPGGVNVRAKIIFEE